MNLISYLYFLSVICYGRQLKEKHLIDAPIIRYLVVTLRNSP